MELNKILTKGLISSLVVLNILAVGKEISLMHESKSLNNEKQQILEEYFANKQEDHKLFIESNENPEIILDESTKAEVVKLNDNLDEVKEEQQDIGLGILCATAGAMFVGIMDKEQ